MSNKKIILSKKNEKAVNDFEKHLISTGKTNTDTLRTYTSACKICLDTIKKDWNKLSNKDIDTIFSSNRMSDSSKELYKLRFYHFLKFKKLNNLADYTKTLFNFNVLKKPTKTSDNILSKDEINKLIQSANNLRDKAIVEIFLTTGGRRKEICYLKLKDIKIEESIIWVTINNSKTKIRRIPIVANKDIETSIYPENLVNFINTHIFKNDKEKPLFYSHYTRRYGQPLNKNSINEILRSVVKKAGINKTITPHILRHTSATYDGHYLTEQDLCLKYGWRIGSEQPKRYCHLTENQLGEHLLKLAGTTEEQIKKDSICPQCKSKVNINDKICSTCKYILDREEQQKHIEELEKDRKNRINLEINTSKLLKKITALENDLNLAVSTLSEQMNKQYFLAYHYKEIAEIEKKYKKLYDNKKITKSEYVNNFKKEADKYYNKYSKNIIKLKTINDLKNTRKNIIDIFLNQTK